MIRQISQRVSHSTISPGGNCCAFLSKNGTVWIVPVTHFSDEDNLTSLPQQRSRARLNPQNFGDHSGRVQFSPGGDRLVAVDKKGKLVIMEFPLEKHWFGRPEGVPAQEAPLAAEMAGWAVKTQVGGYF